MYDFILFLHILGVAMLVGSLAYSLGGFFRAQRASNVEDLRAALTFAPIAERAIGPAMLVLLASGLYMVGDAHWGWDSGWVDVAIALFVLMGILGTQIEGRRIEALKHAADAQGRGPITPDIDAMRRDPVLTHVAVFGASQVVAFFYLMTNKPSLGGALATVVILGALSVPVARLMLRPRAVETEPEAESPVVAQA